MRHRFVTAFAVVAALFAAGPAAAQQTLNIYNWNDYIDDTTIQDFEKETGIKVRYDVYDSNETMDAKLRAGRSGYDLVVPTASPFLATQVDARLYRPIDRAKVPNYKNLDPALMQQLGVYDPGNRHGVPWMWGTTGIGYNTERLLRAMPDAPVYSLKVLFDPAIVSRFKSCGVMILDSATDVIPAALAYLGRNPDSQTREDLEAAMKVLQEIRPFVRKFHSSEYINGLANGDICLAFGYSGDIKQAAKRAEEAKKSFKVEYAIPQEGTLVWIDAWAIPANSLNVDAAHRFLDFVLRPDVVAKNSNFIGYANAVPASLPMLNAEVRDDPAVYPPEELRKRFYTISPADMAYERNRTRAWTRVTTGR